MEHGSKEDQEFSWMPTYDQIFKNRAEGKNLLRLHHPLALRQLNDGCKVIRSWFKNYSEDQSVHDLLFLNYRNHPEMKSKCAEFIKSRLKDIPTLLFRDPNNSENVIEIRWRHSTVYDHIINHRQEFKKNRKRKLISKSLDPDFSNPSANSEFDGSNPTSKPNPSNANSRMKSSNPEPESHGTTSFHRLCTLRPDLMKALMMGGKLIFYGLKDAPSTQGLIQRHQVQALCPTTPLHFEFDDVLGIGTPEGLSDEGEPYTTLVLEVQELNQHCFGSKSKYYLPYCGHICKSPTFASELQLKAKIEIAMTYVQLVTDPAELTKLRSLFCIPKANTSTTQTSLMISKGRVILDKSSMAAIESQGPSLNPKMTVACSRPSLVEVDCEITQKIIFEDIQISSVQTINHHCAESMTTDTDHVKVLDSDIHIMSPAMDSLHVQFAPIHTVEKKIVESRSMLDQNQESLNDIHNHDALSTRYTEVNIPNIVFELDEVPRVASVSSKLDSLKQKLKMERGLKDSQNKKNSDTNSHSQASLDVLTKTHSPTMNNNDEVCDVTELNNTEHEIMLKTSNFTEEALKVIAMIILDVVDKTSISAKIPSFIASTNKHFKVGKKPFVGHSGSSPKQKIAMVVQWGLKTKFITLKGYAKRNLKNGALELSRDNVCLSATFQWSSTD